MGKEIYDINILEESFNKIRTNIQYTGINRKIKSILITSCIKGEGKTTAAIKLAQSFAASGKKVLLADCDFRKPCIYRKFNISNLHGISEVIVGECSMESAVSRITDNLYVMPSGKILLNPSKMINSKSMKELITLMHNTYDITIIDSPPAMLYSDTQILSVIVDSTIIVARADKTHAGELISVKEALLRVNANIAGIIFNGVKINDKKLEYN